MTQQYTKKIKAGTVPISVTEFVGDVGTVFYDPNTMAASPQFYISDGITPGGNPIDFGTSNNAPGLRGNVGYTGSQGIQGDVGYTGSQGAIGATGPIGPENFEIDGGNASTIYTAEIIIDGGNANG